MPIDLALAYVVVSGLIPALQTISPSTIPSSNLLQHPPSAIVSPNSELRKDHIKLLSVDGTVIRYSVVNQDINQS